MKFVNEQYIYSGLSSKVIGCAMTVHKTLGRGFPEGIYRRALQIEMDLEEIPFTMEEEQSIHYRGHIIGKRRVDFLVNGTLLVEIKALSALEKADYAQLYNYLEIFGLKVGLLINFGETSLNFKRLSNKNFER